MKITKTQNGTTLEVALEGRLDTATAPELEASLKDALGEIDELIFDFRKLDYVSSAGLRVLLLANRSLKMGGRTKVVHANEIIKEVFDVTGFDEILELD